MKSNPTLRPFAALIGEWRTTGTHPLVPGKTFHGRTSFAWHLDGAFVLMRSGIDEPEIPDGMAVLGSDDAGGTFSMLYFDEREVSRKYDVTIDGNVLMWRRDEAGFAQRNTITIEDGGARLTGRGEMSRDGGEWEDDLSLTYDRVA